jgi:hypothetical protein
MNSSRDSTAFVFDPRPYRVNARPCYRRDMTLELDLLKEFGDALVAKLEIVERRLDAIEARVSACNSTLDIVVYQNQRLGLAMGLRLGDPKPTPRPKTVTSNDSWTPDENGGR